MRTGTGKIRILLLAAVLAALCAGLVAAASAETVVSEVNLTLKTKTVDLNVAWQEGEVQDRIREPGVMDVTTKGLTMNISNIFLTYKSESGEWYGIGDGSRRVQADTDYAVSYSVQPDNGYDWYPQIKSIPQGGGVPASDYPDFYIYVNSAKRTDAYLSYNPYWNILTVIVPLGKPSTKQFVSEISIDGNDFTMQTGTSASFTATVKGNVDDKSVAWSVSGNKSSKTKISAGGKLTVGKDETAGKIIVKAAAKADPSATAKQTVYLSKEAPTILSVKIEPQKISGCPGTSQQLTLTVTGTQRDKSVTWKITGAVSADTYVSDGGRLYIGADEKEGKLTVRATANRDKTQSAEAELTVQQPAEIAKLALTYDAAAIGLSPAYTEGDVAARVADSLGVTTKHVTKLIIWTGLAQMAGGGKMEEISPKAETKVDQGRKYYFVYRIMPDAGYRWPDSVRNLKSFATVKMSEVQGFTVKANGKTAKAGAYMMYNGSDESITIYIPARFSIDISKAAVSGVKAKTYTGKAIKQKPKIKLYGKTLKAGKDYKITYSKNKNAGKAKMTITGIGDYTGKLTKTFKIKPVKLKSAKLAYTKHKYTGKALKPAVTVKAKVNGKTVKLKLGRDFKVTYKNNKKAGTATVIIKGIGNYTKTIKKTFKIVK